MLRSIVFSWLLYPLASCKRIGCKRRCQMSEYLIIPGYHRCKMRRTVMEDKKKKMNKINKRKQEWDCNWLTLIRQRSETFAKKYQWRWPKVNRSVSISSNRKLISWWYAWLGSGCSSDSDDRRVIIWPRATNITWVAAAGGVDWAKESAASGYSI